MLIASLLAVTSSASELQWRKAGPPKKFKPSTNSQPISATAKSKFTKPAPRRDGAVRAVGFEDDGRGEFEGPAFAEKQAGGLPMRSVVVEEHEKHAVESGERESVRSAQLQFQEPTNDRYNEQISEPFGQGGMESMESESTEIEEEDVTLPPEQVPQPEETTPQDETSRQPRTFQPAPSRNAPRPDPFVEADDEPNAGLPPIDDPTLADEGEAAQKFCTEELAKLKARTLDQVDLSIVVAGDPGQDFPVECSIDDGTWHEGRCWCETTYMWKASALCHKPLYFEDEALERYGHSWGPCVDPFVSGAHFFCKLPVLPYCMGLTPPNECMYALGHYRPGNCAPYMCDPIPLSCRGAIFQAGAVVGAVAIIP
jgi:hypothetical protein